jgi:hypothetical protein
VDIERLRLLPRPVDRPAGFSREAAKHAKGWLPEETICEVTSWDGEYEFTLQPWTLSGSAFSASGDCRSRPHRGRLQQETVFAVAEAGGLGAIASTDNLRMH